MNRPLLLSVLFLSTPLLLFACSSTPPASERIKLAEQLANSAKFEKVIISTNAFELTSFRKTSQRVDGQLVIYLEGDGYAWKSGSLPSENPTPHNPVALSLAIQDPRPLVAYLARPCQFSELPSRGCIESAWTNARFSESVVDSTNEAIEALKRYYGAKELVLIGYSGGGAVATLVAAKRNDVKLVVTVAGNLDTAAWVNYFRLAPLNGSLNPADKVQQLRHIKQVHFIGGNDLVMPKAITQSYLNKLPSSSSAQLIEIKDYGHVCCWQKNWPSLLTQIQ
jgi:pimeloyl-ACP methyl ester carboxylesterase